MNFKGFIPIEKMIDNMGWKVSMKIVFYLSEMLNKPFAFIELIKTLFIHFLFVGNTYIYTLEGYMVFLAVQCDLFCLDLDK